MKIDLAVACDYAVIDQYGKLSIMGIFQHVWVAKFPAVHARMHLVMRIKGKRTEIGQHAIDIQFTDGDEKILLKGSGSVTLAEPPAGVLEIEAGAVLIFDIPLPRAGRYQFEIRIDDQLETIIPLTTSQRAERTPLGGATLH